MPIYDYRCQKCNKVFEVEHKAGNVPMKFCPGCGGGLKRVYNPIGVVFKGSGFYSTDYGKTGKKTEKKTESKPHKSGESKASKS